MKKDMVEYMNSMCSDNLDTLEYIIAHQYRKFVQFYNLVSEYSSLISKLSYDFQSEESLDIILVFDTKRKLENIKDEFEQSMTDRGYNGAISISKKNMMISIILDES